MHTRLAFAAMLAAACVVTADDAPAQPSDSIVANPNAVKLRRIWTIVGREEQDHIGQVGGGIPDINGDGLAEIAFQSILNGTSQWRIYYGGVPAPDTTADWVFDSAPPSSRGTSYVSAWMSYPVVGDFWGDGRRSLIIGDEVWIDTLQTWWILNRMLLFRVDSGKLPREPTLIQPVERVSCMDEALAADLDGDGADELIVSEVCDADLTRTLIYKGGPGFQLDSPTVVVNDGEKNSDRINSIVVGNLDGDEYPDLATAGLYWAGPRLKFWWGRPGSPWNWGDPDRSILLTLDSFPPILGNGITLIDCDGDGIADLLQNGPGLRVYLFRSGGAGKNARTRRFDTSDADQQYYREGYLVTESLGFLNDSNRRYVMGSIGGGAPDGQGSYVLGFSGGPQGMDARYEAHYGPKEDGLGTSNVFGRGHPIPDCNGDGWDDYYTGYHGYGGFNRGIALVLAGGPYIPRDDPTTSVQDIAVAGKARAITVWPNPARQEVNIAWRGDLRAMPRRFEAHRLSGELVARGEVESYRGSALWRCEGLAAGTYLLTVFDADGGVIATARVVKED